MNNNKYNNSQNYRCDCYNSQNDNNKYNNSQNYRCDYYNSQNDNNNYHTCNHTSHNYRCSCNKQDKCTQTKNRLIDTVKQRSSVFEDLIKQKESGHDSESNIIEIGIIPGDSNGLHPDEMNKLMSIISNNIKQMNNTLEEPLEEQSDNISTEELFNEKIIDKWDSVDVKCDTLEDLLIVATLWENKKDIIYPPYFERIYKIKDELKQIINLTGLEDIKKSIVKQIVYLVQEFEDNKHMLHIVITGPPGVGKTLLGKSMGNIIFKLGFLKQHKKKTKQKASSPFSIFNPMMMEPPEKNKSSKEEYPFKIVRMIDLKGQYVGHTTQKTQNAIDEADGGVLFIDEAYAIGGERDHTDPFGYECANVLNQNLSENTNWVCIIAGYKDKIKNDLLSMNPGLDRRFIFRYDINGYNATELKDILVKKIKDDNWKLKEKNIETNIVDMIETHKKIFNNYGGDVETFLLKLKICHGQRLFGLSNDHRKIFIWDDFNNALKYFVAHKEIDIPESIPDHLYS
jgi:hypothetical protein